MVATDDCFTTKSRSPGCLSGRFFRCSECVQHLNAKYVATTPTFFSRRLDDDFQTRVVHVKLIHLEAAGYSCDL